MRKVIIPALVFISFHIQHSFGQNTFPENGSVGIGTTSPNNRLEVSGNTFNRGAFIATANVQSGVLIQRNEDNGSFNTHWEIYAPSSSKDLRIYNTNGGDKFTLTNGGNIGTTTPDRKLTVAADAGLNVKSSTGYYVNLNYLYGTSTAALYSLGPAGGITTLAINPEGGNVGIGTTTPLERLSVNGKIRAKEVKVEVTNWPDYVFGDGYGLEKLEGLERFIKVNKHLPEIPSAAEVEKEGITLGEMNAKLLKKIEELTLHLIHQNKRIESLEKQIEK